VIPFRDDNPTRTFPIVVVALIAANILVQIYVWGLPPERQLIFQSTYGAIPSVLTCQQSLESAIEINLAQAARATPAQVREYLIQHGIQVTPLHPLWLAIFTSMFLHGGLLHLGGNMLYLWIFGNNIEDTLGHFRFLLFYLFCGFAAACAQILMSLGSSVPMIGASGAISGVLAAYLVFFPSARVITLVPLFFWPWFVEIPAVLYLGLWFVSQLLNGLLTIVSGIQAFGGVAWWAHVGGFVAGLVLGPLLARRRYVRRVYVDEYFPW